MRMTTFTPQTAANSVLKMTGAKLQFADGMQRFARPVWACAVSRPTSFTVELGDTILQRVANGESLRAVAASPGMPAESTVRTWGVTDPGFGERLRQAREASAEHWDQEAERVLTEAEGTKEEISRARELAQHFRWRASKYAPRTYGDRLDLNVTGTIGIAAQLAEVRARRKLIDADAEPIPTLPAPDEEHGA